MQNKNRRQVFALEHRTLEFELTSARHRLSFLALFYTDMQIDVMAEAAIAEVRRFRQALKAAIPELDQAPELVPILDAQDMNWRRRVKAKSEVWNPDTIDECYIARSYPLPPFESAQG